MTNKNDRGPGIICPTCGNPHTTTVDSRKGMTGKIRRRRCDNCRSRFRTLELHTSSLSTEQLEREGWSVGGISKEPIPVAEQANVPGGLLSLDPGTVPGQRPPGFGIKTYERLGPDISNMIIIPGEEPR